MDRQWIINFLALLLSAAMLCLTVAYTQLWPLGWVALWPVFFLLKRQPDWRNRLLLGLIWLFCVSQLGFPYAVSTAYRYLHGHLFQAWLMGTALGVVTSTRYLVFMLLASAGKRQGLYWASLWVACELLLWQMMPVYGAVHVLGDRALLQWSEWVGAPGVSWLWFYLSYALFHQRQRALPLFLVVHLIGFVQLHNCQKRSQNDPRHTIAVIQANQPASLEQSVAVGLKAREIMLEQTAILLTETSLHPQVVVWPEASLPLVEYTRLGGLPFLGVELIFTDFEAGSQQGYILARLLDREGNSLASYRKRKLIMMGEWKPADPQNSFQVGDKPVLLPSLAGQALPLICFEGLWPSFVADFQRQTEGKATWLVHLGSESSFASELACYQSLNLLSIRAIETRRPVVRADNSGVSGWIDITGQIHQATLPFTQDSLILQVPMPQEPTLTFYSRYADKPLWVLVVFCIVLQIAGGKRLHQEPVNSEAKGKTNHPGK